MEKLRESIMSEPIKSKGIKELAKNVDNPDDAELIKKMDYLIKSKKNNILLTIKVKYLKYLKLISADL